AGKCRVPSIVLACDAESEVDTPAPDRIVRLWPRQIDLAHTETLKQFEATTVVESSEALKQALKARLDEVNTARG
ncbi:MAG: flavoprotein, partial [Methylophaga sp.]